MKRVLFSRQSDTWETPAALFDVLDAEFGFELDAAATSQTAKVRPFLTPADDALACDWRGDGHRGRVVWLNPPYRQCREFLAKAAAEASRGCTVVALVPARTDTRWFHDYVWDAARHEPRPGVEVRFVRGRIRFVGASAGAPFPSVVIVFRPRVEPER